MDNKLDANSVKLFGDLNTAKFHESKRIDISVYLPKLFFLVVIKNKLSTEKFLLSIAQ
jgi:hypothetical protein